MLHHSIDGYNINMLKTKTLYGLVLAGGMSSRMKTDKSALNVHGKSQLAFCYELLTPYCQQVFISTRPGQLTSTLMKNYSQIHDIEPFINIGPLGGILSAMTQHPEADWLVVACDLPYLNAKTISHLIQFRNTKKFATAFKSTEDDLPEPLCTIYEAHSLDSLLEFRKNSHTCPRKFLINHDVELLTQPDKLALINVNNPDEFRKAKSYFKNQK